MTESTERDFIEAGFSTVAAGYGPFKHGREREEFLAGLAKTATLNVIPLEIVESPDEIRTRHGMTELAGFVLRDIPIKAIELVEFAHLFHPSGANLQVENPDRALLADVAFIGAGSARETRLIVAYRSGPEVTGARRSESMCDYSSLCKLAREFLAHPGQIFFCRCPLDDAPDFLALAAAPSYVPSIPRRTWFAESLLARRVSGEMPTSLFVNGLTLRMAHAWKLRRSGTIRTGAPADITVLPRRILSEDLASVDLSHFVPTYSVVNGVVAWESASGRQRHAVGSVKTAARTAI